MSGYASLSAVYDRLIGMDYGERAEYLLSLFSLHRAPCGTLLDLACGTGSLTLELIRRGCDVIGVDGSPEMLALAAEKAAAAGESPLLLCQDMRELDLYGTVEGAVCTLDGLNHLRRKEEIGEALHRLSLFIQPGGLFIFDVNTPYKHRQVLGDNAFVYEGEDFLCAWRNRLNARTSEVHMWLDIFFEEEDGRYQRLEEEIVERAYSLATWRDLLKKADFTPLEVYGDMTAAAPGPEEQRWVIVARNDTKIYER